MKKHMVSMSLRKAITIYIMIVLSCVVGFLLFYHHYSVTYIQNQVYQSNQRSQSYRAKIIEDNLVSIDDYLLGLVANDINFSELRNVNSELKNHLLGVSIKKDFQQALSRNNLIFGYISVSSANNFYRSEFASNLGYDIHMEIRNYVESITANGENLLKRGWWNQKIGDENYLFRCFGVNGNYVLGVIRLKQINNSFFGNSYSTGIDMAIGDTNNLPLTNLVSLEKEGIILDASIDDFIITGNNSQYMLMSNPIKNTDIILYGYIVNANFFDGMDSVQLFAFIFSIFAAILVPITYIFIQKMLVKPTNDIITTLDDIGNGNISRKMRTDYNFNEFNSIGYSFNQMMYQVNELKISGMQKEIEKQNAELQYLYLQIRPHFFLNCLKNIYAMAEKKRYSLVQDLTIAISKHFRYIMEDITKLIRVCEEIEFVGNYISIQKITNTEEIICELEVDEKANQIKIPPLLVQSFVENSIKYASTPNKALEIFISISVLKLEDKDFLDIIIKDNGQGFDNEVLELINSQSLEIFSGKNVGISNVKQRLKIIYGDEASFAFYNDAQGAVSEIVIPTTIIDNKGGKIT